MARPDEFDLELGGRETSEREPVGGQLAVPYLTTVHADFPLAADGTPPHHGSQRGARRSRLAIALASFSALLALGVLGVFAYGVYRYRALLEVPDVTAEDDEPKTRRAVERDEDDDEERVDGAPTTPPPGVPEKTAVVREGALQVVDVGIEAPSLKNVLREQQVAAEADGQTLLLMLTGRQCDPCRGFDSSLPDPRMQEALSGVRLVRVDLNVFAEELDRLALPSRLYPAFFLLGPDLRPRDAIHGGEWDADIPENIAPVMGAFVAGSYEKRRHPDFPYSTTAIPM